MEKILSKEEFQKLINLDGEIRGAAIQQVSGYLEKEEGPEGLEKLERVLESFGKPIKYSEIKMLEFYPLGIEACLLVAAERLFNYTDKDFYKMGEFAPRSSVLMVRTFMKYFVSLDALSAHAPKIWRQHYTVGNLKVIKANEKERQVIARLENFNYVPMACHVYRGYFASSLSMIMKQPAKCEEPKCPHRGDDYHEFVMSW